MDLATWSDQHSITGKIQDDELRTSVASNPNGNGIEVLSTFFSTESQKNLEVSIQKAVIDRITNGKTDFERVMIDNGASKSPSGLPAYIRYCAFTKLKPRISPSTRIFSGLGDGTKKSLGTAKVRIPISTYLIIYFQVELIDQDIPLIFGLEQHRFHKCSTNENDLTFTHHPSNTTTKIEFLSESKEDPNIGHLWLKWNFCNVLYSKIELKKLHKQFGHPSNNALIQLLRRATPHKLKPDTRTILDDIVKRCSPCQTYAPRSSHFRVTMPQDDIIFNHEIECHIFWINNEPVLHIIDRGTRYSVAKYMEVMSAEHAWDIIVEFWITVFTVFSAVIAADRQSCFRAKWFKNTCNTLGIHAKVTATENQNSLGLCERYHAPIRRIFNKLKIDFPSMGKKQCLSLATHAVNNTAGPDGLTPTVLLFGTTPRIPLAHLENMRVDQKARFKAMEMARKEMTTITCQKRVAAALKHRIGPDKPKFEFGDQARIYRGRSK